MADVYGVNTDENLISTSMGAIQYDFLVIASGSENQFFNFEPIKNKLLTLKSLPEALRMRNTIFQNLERALTLDMDGSLEEIMNIAIVGGGPAGVELAGALAEMRKHVVPQEFPELPLSKMNVNLYQSGPVLLAGMSEEASKKCLEYLRELGVNVFLNTRVKEYDGNTLIMDDESRFTTDTVIWSAGVRGAPIRGLPATSIDKGKRIVVDEFNRVKGVENIFAIGDVAAHITPENPRGLPMLAPVAQQQGRHLARNILRCCENQPMEPFEYHNKGVMATIGRKRAVVDLPGFKFQGGFAWFVWMFVHIISLVGFRDKTVAFIDWAVSYFSYDQPLGMILKAAETPPSHIEQEMERVEQVK